MDRNQWALLSFGILSLSGMIFYHKRLTKQKQDYKNKLQKFHKVYSQSLTGKSQQLEQIMRTKEGVSILQKDICFLKVDPKYNKSTFKLFQRQRSLFLEQNKYKIPQILQNQMGGDFTFAYREKAIKCKLNDFSVSSTLFSQVKKPVRLFQGLNNVQPLVCSVMTTLNPLLTVSVFGKLYFDENNLEWSIDPYFLTQSSQFKRRIQLFYAQHMERIVWYKFAVLVGSLALSYFTFLPLIKSLKKKLGIAKQQKELLNQLQFFKNKEHLMVNRQNLLTCQKCKIRSVQIVYQCGHLVLCQQCHEDSKLLLRNCPLCGKQSRMFMRIYMS